ncbi:MAG: Ig-like domain-containing protein [Verrucomicrobiia bacterium]
MAAGSVTLAWNPSADPLVVGYNVYYGAASATYTNEISAGTATNISISGLVPGTTYYFAATTYNAANMESAYSSEVSYLVPQNVSGNQPPTLNPIANLTINENTGLRTVSLSGITSGAPNEIQTLTVTAFSSNTNLIPNPAVSYVSANTTGSLSFTPVINGNGTAIITVTVNDGGASNNLVTQTFTVTVSPVNQPPTLNAISPLTINENAGLQTVNLSGITSGAANENQTLTVTAASSNTGLVPNPTVNYASANPTGSLTFTPVVNGNGTATITVKVNDGGTSNNIVTQTFTVKVNPVNQPPTLNAINPLTINENAGLQTVNLSGITSGAANENQTLTVTAASSNTGLIPNPTVNYTSAKTNGTITFTPVVNANGTATITVKVNDGGASNNIVTRTFTVTVNPVNQPPTLNAIGNLTINKNAGLQTVNLSGISSGAANENQTLTITATSSNTGLIPNPTVNYTSPNPAGSLTFAPLANTNGSAIITVTVNDGGTSNNLVTQTFTINVLAVNDLTRPTAQITAPTSNQQLTNGGFTVTGKASDNVAVAAVYCSINGSGWSPAATVNGWTNWTANVTLTPGPNTIQAYAVDTSGNLSPTNSVSFTYAVYAPLTVKVNGGGSVNPNCNGMRLMVGEPYAMTANAAGGFVFTNWTVGGSTVLTNKQTLSFTMASNLVFTANFVDVAKPTLNIVAPTSNQQLTNGGFTVTGTAQDNLAVGTVRYSLNGSSWTAATTVNGWTNWTANVTLTPGPNTIQAYAVDTTGNISSTNSVTFHYVVYTPLTVKVNGGGSINPNYNGVQLKVGEPYAMTANAAGGFVFTNWTGGGSTVLTNKQTLSFTMASNLVFTANFVDGAKPTLSLVAPTSNQQLTNGGFTVTGKASDNVAVGTVHYSLNGSGWTPATTVNGWTNWTANVTLTPGPNTIQAYAVDTTGNISSTNSVTFHYVVYTPLTVKVNGGGSINPNYNGVQLKVGEPYSMSASAAGGCIFTNWTGGGSTVLTNKQTLSFTMASNLVFTANFVDVTKPTISISAPGMNSHVASAAFVVTGQAGDNVAVTNVYYSLNGSGWIPAMTANAWKNWTANVTLTPGANTLLAYAVDTTGNRSSTNSVSFVYDSSPSSISGLMGAVNENGGGTFYLCFGNGTFSQNSGNTNYDNGVGNYSYQKLTANTAKVALTYTAPPSLAGSSNIVLLTFITNNFCVFSNQYDAANTGTISFWTVPNWATVSLNGRKSALIAGGGQTTVGFGGNTLTITNAIGQVKNGTYTFKQYSPVGALVTEILPQETNYLELTFAATNYGIFANTAYVGSSNAPTAEAGIFALLSQLPGGNAPMALSGQAAQVTQPDAVFGMGFGIATFSQDSSDTNYANGVGSYTYTRLGTNSAQLSMVYTAPPTSGSTVGPVVLTFIAPNFCVLTNQDGSGSNTLAAMSFWTPPTNWVPTSLTGRIISTTNAEGVVDVVTYNGDGTFSQTETGSSSPGVSSGTYVFTPYSPVGAMLVLTYNGGVQAGSVAYIQITFTGQGAGSFFVTFYDALADPPVAGYGDFGIQ